jgi:hypothetical protein
MDERTHPMTCKNEDELKKALEIDTWKNLSRDTMIKFVATVPDMDKEGSKAIYPGHDHGDRKTRVRQGQRE